MFLASTLQTLFKRCKVTLYPPQWGNTESRCRLEPVVEMDEEAKRSMGNLLELLELEDDLELLKEEGAEVGTVETVEIRVVVDPGEVKVEIFVETEVTVEVVLTVVVPLGFTTVEVVLTVVVPLGFTTVEVVLTVVVPLGFTTVEVVLTVDTLPAAVDTDVTVRTEVLDATVEMDVTVRVVPVV
jgi:hypothetical protein